MRPFRNCNWRCLLVGACHGTAWAVALALGAGVVLRLLCFDAAYELVWFNAFTVYVYLPAYLCLAWAVWWRRWRLATLSSLIAAFHLACIMPDIVPLRQAAAGKRGNAVGETIRPTAAEPLRLFFANVYYSNRQIDAMFAEAAHADPDVLVFVEFGHRWYRAARQSAFLKKYPYQGRQQHRNRQGIAIWSRRPLREVPLAPKQPRKTMLVDVVLGDQLLRLFCLHSPRPVDNSWADYFQYWQQISTTLAEQPEPLLVVGDFNTTQHSRIYKEVTAGNLRGAHESCDRGYATTWPNSYFWMPPIRIDHALLSPGVQCVRIAEGEGPGSDHRPLILDVRVE